MNTVPPTKETIAVHINDEQERALRSSMYTSIAYLVISNPYVSLAFMLAVAIVIILFFTYYTSVVKDLNFGRRFGEMATTSLGGSAISFGIGVVVKRLLGVDI